MLGVRRGHGTIDRVAIPAGMIDALAKAERVVVLTGAGVSAESGVPTFRDALTGLWSNFKPEELATPRAFRRNPKLVWEWYAWRRKLVQEVSPNPGHVALAEMARLFPKFTLVTQNVDGLHQRAGSTDVIELHGNISRTKCFTEDAVIDEWTETADVPPRCPRCGGMLRPDVVWFEEALPDHAIRLACARADDCDVFLSVGTSGLVFPAADLPMRALRAGATVVEMNPERTALAAKAQFTIAAPAGVALPEIVAELRSRGYRKPGV
jgi:NAD-dependent deacetylase